MISAPGQIGSHVSEVDTPALLIELDALERNIHRMQERIAGTRLRLRPHAKTHKSTAIANMQLAAGAVGVCCQKVSEAEILVDGGIGDVLISNEVIGTAKLDRVAALARRAKVAVCVDDLENAEQLAAAAGKFGARIDVLVELNVGANRCGVETAAEAVRLAAERAIVDAGLKALSVDSGMPLVAGCDGVSYAGASDEHGRLDVGGNQGFKLGEKIRLVPGHCDPTVNLHDWFVGIRNGHVEAV